MILSIWAQSSNLLWLRFQCYGGPTLAQKYVNSSWLFLQHWSWQTSKSRTFCLCSSRLFEADDSLCVTSSCFPPFPPGPPPTWEDWQGQGGLWNSSCCWWLLFSFVGIPLGSCLDLFLFSVFTGQLAPNLGFLFFLQHFSSRIYLPAYVLVSLAE